VIAKKVFALAGTAVAWLILFGLVRGVLSLGDCLDEAACWNGKGRIETGALFVLGGSYLMIAWLVIRSRKL